jgi:hypothetical protein
MYGATATLELHRPGQAPAEEVCDRVEKFLWAVSAGWSQVMSFLETCELDGRAHEILRELQRSDSDR